MSKIFISYRRDDPAAAWRIYYCLLDHFRRDDVFIDSHAIPLGEDFRKRIATALGQSQVVLAVITTKWAGESDARRRLEDPGDFVRIELEAALDRDIPVIPLLIDDVEMPAGADLPPSLADFPFRKGFLSIRGEDFLTHVDKLIAGIKSFAPPKRRNVGWLKFCAVVLPLSAFLSGIFIYYPDNKVPPSPSHSLNGRERTNSIGMKLIRIEAGNFPMGSTPDQFDRMMNLVPNFKREWSNGEQPQHTVEIGPFSLGMHPVTQRQYEAVMGTNPSEFKGSKDLPVEGVSWIDAVTFCNKLSEMERRKPFYRIDGTEVAIVEGNGYRLPTEAEWEYACRAGSKTLYPVGDDVNELGEYAWYDVNSEGMTRPVGGKKPNAWGFHDMLGNVWEWCGDWYDKTYYTSSPPSNPPGPPPPGPPGSAFRVVRGGSWYNDAQYVRGACRGRFNPSYRNNTLGFRCARSLPSGPMSLAE